MIPGLARGDVAVRDEGMTGRILITASVGSVGIHAFFFTHQRVFWVLLYLIPIIRGIRNEKITRIERP